MQRQIFAGISVRHLMSNLGKSARILLGIYENPVRESGAIPILHSDSCQIQRLTQSIECRVEYRVNPCII